MKRIRKISEPSTLYEVYTVISEPGDCTRYDYMIIAYGEYFKFISFVNKFRYPTLIEAFELGREEEALAHEVARRDNCNPFTALECIRRVKEIFKMGE